MTCVINVAKYKLCYSITSMKLLKNYFSHLVLLNYFLEKFEQVVLLKWLFANYKLQLKMFTWQNV